MIKRVDFGQPFCYYIGTETNEEELMLRSIQY